MTIQRLAHLKAQVCHAPSLPIRKQRAILQLQPVTYLEISQLTEPMHEDTFTLFQLIAIKERIQIYRFTQIMENIQLI